MISLVFSSTGSDEDTVQPCNHADKGCCWEGTSAERTKHQCDFDIVTCPHATHGCTHQEQRMYLDDHIPFCRFIPFKCPSCGRGDMFTSQYVQHVERACPKFHRYRKRATGVNEEKENPKGQNNKQRSSARTLNAKQRGKRTRLSKAQQKEQNKKWIYTWISSKHLNQAFDLSCNFEQRQVDERADIKVGRAQEDMDQRIDESAEKLNAVTSEIYEEDGKENPYSWSVDKLLMFCDKYKLRRVNKRKKQASIVQEFLLRRANSEHEQLVTREEALYLDIEKRWQNTCKNVRRLGDSRRTAAAERLSKETLTN